MRPKGAPWQRCWRRCCCNSYYCCRVAATDLMALCLKHQTRLQLTQFKGNSLGTPPRSLSRGCQSQHSIMVMDRGSSSSCSGRGNSRGNNVHARKLQAAQSTLASLFDPFALHAHNDGRTGAQGTRQAEGKGGGREGQRQRQPHPGIKVAGETSTSTRRRCCR